MMALRIRPVAPFGSLLKGASPPKRRKADLGRAPRERDERHLDAIRDLPCLACGLEGQTEAAHLRCPGRASRMPASAPSLTTAMHCRCVVRITANSTQLARKRSGPPPASTVQGG